MKAWWTREDSKRRDREPRVGLALVLGAVASFAAAGPAAGLEVTVRTADGEEAFGRLVSFSLAEGLEWQPGDSNIVRVSSDEVVSITAYDHPVVTLAKTAAANLGREMATKTSGGGSDANIFFGNGVVTGILGTGMKDMHTIRESVRLDDMVKGVELLVEIARVHAGG